MIRPFYLQVLNTLLHYAATMKNKTVVDQFGPPYKAEKKNGQNYKET